MIVLPTLTGRVGLREKLKLITLTSLLLRESCTLPPWGSLPGRQGMENKRLVF
jgi:hypothetical protein